jgi:hypothetical protein
LGILSIPSTTQSIPHIYLRAFRILIIQNEAIIWHLVTESTREATIITIETKIRVVKNMK